ncbi:hypothetical protein BCT08_23550 [Vibrio splendidus]|nr:hypothetical protein BCT08_23550 [Vibrio splendidus]
MKGCRESLNHILASDSKVFVSFVNPFSYSQICDIPNAIEDIDVFYSDGILFSRLFSFFNPSRIERMSFDYSSIASDVFNYLQDKKLTLAVVGAKDNEIDVFIENLKQRFEFLDVVYHRNGYFEESEYSVIASDISNSNADFILLGLGSPKQEKFGSYLKNHMSKSVKIFTCGGFIYQTSLRDEYYLPWVKKFNLMWLQRFIMHSFVRKRLLVDYPKFVLSYSFGFICPGRISGS